MARTTHSPPALDPAWIRGLPKAEVHVHLEGCVPLDTVGLDAVDAGFHDLAGFLAFLDRSCAAVTTTEQLEAIGHGLVARAAACGVGHTDAIVNPCHWPAWRERPDDFVAAIDAGMAAGEEEYGLTAALCWSLLRTETPREWESQVGWLLASRPPRIVALSVDGDEKAAGRTGPALAPFFTKAREAGLRTCAHAGESSGPGGVRDAIDLLAAERIDHGVRAIEDPALVTELAVRAIPLDICPTSNVRLGLYPSLADHPVEIFRHAGVAVTLNTDDPLLFGCDVPGEYQAAALQFAWGRQEMSAIARTSITACFAPEARRAELLTDLDNYLRS